MIAQLYMWCFRCKRQNRHVIIGTYFSRCQVCGNERRNTDAVRRAYENSKG